jgi:hygromycin-B 4-O-kinase
MLKLKSRPVLNHGDLRLKNVIADEGGKILAIIDWEKATSNVAPHWDLSIALHDLGIDQKQQFIEGYGIAPKRLADIAPYIKAFNLLNYAEAIGSAIKSKNKPELAKLSTRLSGDLDLYSIA